MSGNPAGKPKGTRHRATMAVQALLDGQAQAITQRCVELAMAGDTTALRLCMERLAPAMKSRPVAIDLPAIDTIGDVLRAQSAVLAAMAGGTITPDEAATIAGLVDAKRKAIEANELERRLRAVENKIGDR